ncbi:MAG: hypothetical protein WBL28_04325 [Methylotenera sp.]
MSVNIENGNISQRVIVNYDYEYMKISVGDKVIDADLATELFSPYIMQGKVVLDATTLGFSELFFAIKSLVDLNVNDFLIIYVEPRDYSRTTPGADSFALSELNAGYKPIPRSVVDLAGDDVDAGVFFLGFEPERLERAFEEYQMLSTKDIKVVFGIPAFQPGWELNSIVPHLSVIENCTIAYCAANDPSSAYDALEVTRTSLGQEKKMFIAPIGTKPCGVAAALFASIYPSQAGLLFDHRKKKTKRSSGVNIWHRYSIKIIN